MSINKILYNIQAQLYLHDLWLTNYYVILWWSKVRLVNCYGSAYVALQWSDEVWTILIMRHRWLGGCLRGLLLGLFRNVFEGLWYGLLWICMALFMCLSWGSLLSLRWGLLNGLGLLQILLCYRWKIHFLFGKVINWTNLLWSVRKGLFFFWLFWFAVENVIFRKGVLGDFLHWLIVRGSPRMWGAGTGVLQWLVVTRLGPPVWTGLELCSQSVSQHQAKGGCQPLQVRWGQVS